jgi:hypothetical protein
MAAKQSCTPLDLLIRRSSTPCFVGLHLLNQAMVFIKVIQHKPVTAKMPYVTQG